MEQFNHISAIFIVTFHTERAGLYILRYLTPPFLLPELLTWQAQCPHCSVWCVPECSKFGQFQCVVHVQCVLYTDKIKVLNYSEVVLSN